MPMGKSIMGGRYGKISVIHYSLQGGCREDDNRVRKYCLVTFGCQMNVHDSEKIAGIFQAEDYCETADPGEADVVIFNTCSIRQKAEQKFFSSLGRLRALKRKRPGLKIAVAGCIAQQKAQEILARAPFVDFIIGPQNLQSFKQITREAAPLISIEDNPSLAETELPAERADTVRAWVTIMYGCNNFCSYCIVPYTRGRERSRSCASILNEIEELASKGYKEVTLLGQNVNSYGSETDFPGLLKQINAVPGIERIRFVTSHPKDLSDRLIRAMGGLDKVCDHIHLPLQSGSTRILGLMNRSYTYDDYRRNVEKLRKELPSIAITSDIIAGFPTETEEDHRRTLEALREVEFDGLFAFNFSPRPGTKAAGMEGQLEEEAISQRLYEILDLQNSITDRKNKAFEGTLQEVLVEGPDEKNRALLTGRTRANKIVTFPSEPSYRPGDLVKVAITKSCRHSLQGVV